VSVEVDKYMKHDLPSVCSVNPDFVDLLWVISEILNVSQNVAAAVLTDEVSEICSQSHICNCRLVVAPFLNGESFEEDEALPI
jgi:hypothetical protein